MVGEVARSSTQTGKDRGALYSHLPQEQVAYQLVGGAAVKNRLIQACFLVSEKRVRG
jgi:hypothetical protein